eukprot:2832028-Pleurochrysis_carterae.AAC.1
MHGIACTPPHACHRRHAIARTISHNARTQSHERHRTRIIACTPSRARHRMHAIACTPSHAHHRITPSHARPRMNAIA